MSDKLAKTGLASKEGEYSMQEYLIRSSGNTNTNYNNNSGSSGKLINFFIFLSLNNFTFHIVDGYFKSF